MLNVGPPLAAPSTTYAPRAQSATPTTNQEKAAALLQQLNKYTTPGRTVRVNITDMDTKLAAAYDDYSQHIPSGMFNSGAAASQSPHTALITAISKHLTIQQVVQLKQAGYPLDHLEDDFDVVDTSEGVSIAPEFSNLYYQCLAESPFNQIVFPGTHEWFLFVHATYNNILPKKADEVVCKKTCQQALVACLKASIIKHIEQQLSQMPLVKFESSTEMQFGPKLLSQALTDLPRNFGKLPPQFIVAHLVPMAQFLLGEIPQQQTTANTIDEQKQQVFALLTRARDALKSQDETIPAIFNNFEPKHTLALLATTQSYYPYILGMHYLATLGLTPDTDSVKLTPTIDATNSTLQMQITYSVVNVQAAANLTMQLVGQTTSPENMTQLRANLHLLTFRIIINLTFYSNGEPHYRIIPRGDGSLLTKAELQQCELQLA